MSGAGLWRTVLTGARPWVLFEHGTCVVLTEPEGDLAHQATELLRTFGPVRAGGAAGDFGVITLDEGGGWLVTSYRPDVLTHVAPGEPPAESDVTIGLYGRSKRHRDATELHVVHVEDAPGPA
ncbi:hypothetical protein GCM10022380_58070 [Amycolatopsis tucumanensis]|uniref:Uncharacterized protein n=1 Tax=Amycolatopsis tucumanensis TaxID=401106 RepID=A0ABP7J224_9PSEU